jgi:hypothetical protein
MASLGCSLPLWPRCCDYSLAGIVQCYAGWKFNQKDFYVTQHDLFLGYSLDNFYILLLE